MANLEIESFKELWEGGYCEGNPLDPHAHSSYSALDALNGYSDQRARTADGTVTAEETGFLSTLYVTYLMTIRNRAAGRTVLEIGPGRGPWTQAILQDGAKFVYALDALSPEHNAFYEYIGEASRERVKYSVVEDFSCREVPDGSIDFVFSFGCFCHLSRASVLQYMSSIYHKMKSGADGFIMISDYDKRDKVLGVVSNKEEDLTPSPGRWYHLGTDWFVSTIESLGFEVLDRDIGCNLRDPVVHFRRR